MKKKKSARIALINRNKSDYAFKIENKQHFKARLRIK